MTSRDFCYWLQGFFEVRDAQGGAANQFPLTVAQEDMVKRHLALVFKHEIDPSMGPAAHQAALNDIHSPPPTKPAALPASYLHGGDSALIRC